VIPRMRDREWAIGNMISSTLYICFNQFGIGLLLIDSKVIHESKLISDLISDCKTALITLKHLSSTGSI